MDRQRWLSTLVALVGRLPPGEFSPTLFEALYDAARAEPTRGGGCRSGRAASQIALLGCKLAELLIAGVEQRVAASQLGVSERTAKHYARRLRQVVEDGSLEVRVVQGMVAPMCSTPEPANGHDAGV